MASVFTLVRKQVPGLCREAVSVAAPLPVFIKRLRRYAERRRLPAQFRPLPPVAAKAFGQAADFVVALLMRGVFLQHSIHESPHVGRQVLDHAKRGDLRHHLAVTAGQVQDYAFLVRAPSERPPVRLQPGKEVWINHGGRKVCADRLERSLVDPRPLGKPLGEQFSVVDDEFEAFRRLG